MNKKYIDEAIDLATKWQDRAEQLKENKEKKFHSKMQALLKNPKDKVMLIELLDRSFRSSNTDRVADEIKYIFYKHGFASFFSSFEKFLIYMFLNVGKYFTEISVPLFVEQIRNDTKDLVINGEIDKLNAHLLKKKVNNERTNINLIGELVLGEDEAKERIQKYLNILTNPNVDYISIKISTIFSQINSLSFDDTVDQLVQRLSLIYRQAKKYKFINNNKEEYKFINLDMEEYRDLEITVDVFKKTLDLEEFKDFSAGIVLQAYLPDSLAKLEELGAWSKKRVENGSPPIKVRIVKGANMEMEATEASLKHWEIANFVKKIDTDSNYKKMLNFILDKENSKYLKVGVASHNLFELAYAYTLAKNNSVLDNFSFEMLEGMSDSARRAIEESSGKVLLYAPVAEREQFTNAIAYLVRRLDENTNEDNFIRYSFGLSTKSKEWEFLKEAFIKSFDNIDKLSNESRRKQNRLKEEEKVSSFSTNKYEPEADTDFVLKDNLRWAKGIRDKYSNFSSCDVPLVLNGEEIYDRDKREIFDKSLNKVIATFNLANKDDMVKAVKVAKKDEDSWRSKSTEEIYEILSKVSKEFRKKRGDLIGIAAAEVGKIFTETDVEVSESIDFIEFYPYALREFKKYENVNFKAKGVGLVVSPWNFPIAIPVGGIVSALATGNTVILKPSSLSALCAYHLCKCFWDSGVSKKTLQFLPSDGSLANKYLVSSSDIDFTILTGGESTAYKMLKTKNDIFLSAETGGKNATIVTNMADREQALKNVCMSAFNNSGQKCSATSLLILEDEVYEDEKFKQALIDAAKSIKVGSVWNLINKIGPLSSKPSGHLKKALEFLEKSEEWLLKPSFVEDNPYILKPCIRWGTKKDDYTHMNELFAPVLSVMKAKNLKEAVDLVNHTGYGLTSGLESLDEREQEYWKNNIKAGNLYINRPTTGAIVLRQPFGGMGKSVVGAGRKAGTFNYITQFMDISDKKIREISYEHPLKDKLLSLNSDKEDIKKAILALGSYLKAKEEEFSREIDYFNIRGEDNIFKYIPLRSLIFRITRKDSLLDILCIYLASKVSGLKVSISSLSEDISEDFSYFLSIKDKIIDEDDNVYIESEKVFIEKIKDFDRLRYANSLNISKEVYEYCADNVIYIARDKPLCEGRFELLHYHLEQSISVSYHRYGNLGSRILKH